MPPKRRRQEVDDETPKKKQKTVDPSQQYTTKTEEIISKTLDVIILPDLLKIIKSYCAYICICGRMTDIPKSKVCKGCVAHPFDQCFDCRHPIMLSETNWMIHEIRWNLYQKHYNTPNNPLWADLGKINKASRDFPAGRECYALYRYKTNPWDTATRQRRDKSLWNTYWSWNGGVECLRVVSICHICRFKSKMPYNGVWDGS